MAESNSVLRIENVTMQFGGVVAVRDLCLEVNRGEIVSLIGPNGAGKTTAFNTITGVYQPTNGAIYFNDKLVIESHPKGKMKKTYASGHAGEYRNFIRKTPDQLTKLGMARTFQNIRLFSSMTVFDNVLTAMHLRRTSNLFTAMLHLNHKEEQKMRQETMAFLDLVELSDVKDELAISLPYGKQRKLEIARALATKPSFLLLDEPAAGMNPQETEELTDFIRTIRDIFNLTVLLIEHHMNLVMDISDRIYVIDFGQKIAEGTPAQVQQNQRVIDAYLGVADEDE